LSDRSIRRLGLVEIADAIRAGRLSSVEATRACLDAIEARQPTLNAFISADPEGALRQAEAADRALARGEEVGPLHGVPLAHKDMFYRQGVITTCGAKIRADFRPGETATVLERLKAAGALHLGGLNMAEFALGPTGHNAHFGDCHNPWEPSRIPGGSSSGSGAAVAARLVFGALGSDTGGSIRHPAAFCGLVGLKPTAGRVSRAGAMPLSPALDCIGPLTRRVEDCARLTRLIAGPDPRDPTAAARPAPDYEATLGRGVRGQRIGILRDGYMFRHVPRAGRDALEHASTVFAQLGSELVLLPPPDFDRLAALSSVVMRAETAALHANWLRTRPNDYSAQLRARLMAGLMVPAVSYLEATAVRGRLVRDFCSEVFSRCEALLLPVIGTPAPTLAETAADDPRGLAERVMPIAHASRPINYLGLPALSLPCEPVEGLPYGFQLVGRPFAEARLLQLGYAYQQATSFHARVPDLA